MGKILKNNEDKAIDIKLEISTKGYMKPNGDVYIKDGEDITAKADGSISSIRNLLFQVMQENALIAQIVVESCSVYASKKDAKLAYELMRFSINNF